MIKEGIGSEIKRLRLERGLTFEALGHYASVGVTFLKEIEAGEKQPTVTTIFKLSKVLNVTPDKLLLPTYERWRMAQSNIEDY